VAKAKPGHRLVLQLDPRIALEAIILNRLERIPTPRRQEWLRGLLVLGFRSECQTLRGAVVEPQHHPTVVFTNWNAREKKKTVSPEKSEPVITKEVPPKTSTGSKPFATLGKVIG